jgi:hypothetical protein
VPDNGWIVWASNREDSRHEIYLMKVDGTAVTRLTYEGATFPSWSPEGRWISYRAADGSTHVMPWDRSEDKIICRSQPRFWMHDGSGIVCGDQQEFFLVDPDTGSKRLLFRRSDFPRVARHELNPSGISHDSRWLVAHSDLYRRGYGGDNGHYKAYHAAIILDLTDRSKIYYFGSGCEATTPPAGELLYHVCADCATQPDIYAMKVSDVLTRVSYRVEMAHEDPEWGHEYFPRISTDNEWLTWGASTGCHNADTCDYEIFVHKLGEDSSNRTRMTYDKHNDRWPHLFVGNLRKPSPKASGCGVIQRERESICLVVDSGCGLADRLHTSGTPEPPSRLARHHPPGSSLHLRRRAAHGASS